MNIEQKLGLLRDLGIDVDKHNNEEIEGKFNVVLYNSRTLDEYASMLEECYDTESIGFLARYIDYDLVMRDLELGGDVASFEWGYEKRYIDQCDIYDISNLYFQ